jgi:hypothetical protein
MLALKALKSLHVTLETCYIFCWIWGSHIGDHEDTGYDVV